MISRRYLFLSGSPRGTRSTSYSILSYLIDQLDLDPTNNPVLILHKVLRDDKELESLFLKFNNVEYIVLASPLYVDSLPSHVIQFLMRIREFQRTSVQQNKPKLIAIVNSGFPESAHNHLALDILQKFTEAVGFQWAGGLPFGGGEAVNGTPISKAGFRGRKIRPALDTLAGALSRGDDVPDTAIQKIREPLMPKRLYIMAAQSGWKSKAKKKGCLEDLNKVPYLEDVSLQL